MSTSKSNIGGDWKNQSDVFVNINGEWKEIETSFVNVNGEWKQSTFGGAPQAPVLDWNSKGKFEIVGYKSYLEYTPTLVSGSGTATLDKTTGIFTLSAEDSAFNVTAAYSIGDKQSVPGYMERKKITQTTIAQCTWVAATCKTNEDYPAQKTETPYTIEGNTSNCAMYTCNPTYTLTGPDGTNRCLCQRGFESIYVVGGGQCPQGWSVCLGNRCCFYGISTTYNCPAGGTLSGTTCKKEGEVDCSYWAPCNVDNSTPLGYNSSGTTANGGEWWRITI